MFKNFPMLVLTGVLALAPSRLVAGDAEEGRKIAETWCISCHQVSPGTGGRDTAPPFSAIAEDRIFDEHMMRRTLSDPHPPMPRIHLSRRQIEDIIAYIHSLRRRN